MWRCNKILNHRICYCTSTAINENGLFICKQCRAILKLGDGNSGIGAGVVELDELTAMMQVNANIKYEEEYARNLRKKT